jgi:hypothetical protein
MERSIPAGPGSTADNPARFGRVLREMRSWWAFKIVAPNPLPSSLEISRVGYRPAMAVSFETSSSLQGLRRIRGSSGYF